MVTDRAVRKATLWTICIAASLLSGCDVQKSDTFREQYRGSEPPLLSGQNDYRLLPGDRRVNFAMSSSYTGTEEAPGTASVLASCVTGPTTVTTSPYYFSADVNLNITGEAAPADAAITDVLNAMSPFPALDIDVPEGKWKIEVQGYLDTYTGTVSTSIEEYFLGQWHYVDDSAAIWNISHKIFWLDIIGSECHEQGLIT